MDLQRTSFGSAIDPATRSAIKTAEPTFRECAEALMIELAIRKRKPARNSTLCMWNSALRNWILPALGDLPIIEVKNSTVRPLIACFVEAGLSANTINCYFRLIQKVVASHVDRLGEPIYPRNWNLDFLDLPVIDQRTTNRPCFGQDIISGLAGWRFPRARTLFILAAASGARIHELLGLDVHEHLSPDCSTLRIERQAYRGVIVDHVKTRSSYREIDLHQEVAGFLQQFVGNRSAGLLFRTSSGRPLHLHDVLKNHLHPALCELGYINACTGSNKAGTHAFRRFRNTHLGKCAGLPDSLRKYWMGHRDPTITGVYDKSCLDREFRKMWAERCGIGFTLPPSPQD